MVDVVTVGVSIFCTVVCLRDSITSGIVISIFNIGFFVIVLVVVVVDGDDTFVIIKRCDLIFGKPN